MAATLPAPPDPTSSPWLHLAAPVGKVAAWFLIGSNFLLLFAPLAFLLNPTGYMDPNGRGSSLVVLLSDPSRLLSIADFVAIIGVVVLACSLFLIVLGLVRAEKKVRFDAFLLGCATFGCLAAWVPTMLYAQGRARGTVASVDAAAATGGWSVAAVLLLAASLTYLFFTIRLENGTRTLKLGSFKWPIYAAVNLLGSAAIAGYVQGGSSNVDAFSLGLVLKVTLIPMLGVMAYQDLRDKFPLWAHVPLHAESTRPPAVAAKPTPVQALVARPLPPPPDD